MERIRRRTVLKAGIGVGVSLKLLPTLAAGQDQAALRPQPGDLLVSATDVAGVPLTPDDVSQGAAPIFAWALDAGSRTVRNGSRLNQVLLVRLDAGALRPETGARAAAGVTAYTAICTHMGCEVDVWLADEQLLYCACHGSKFDPRDGARVVEGEAGRPLPALPLTLSDGKLTVSGPFTSRVGFETA
jgi:Rieske Fe-S protein